MSKSFYTDYSKHMIRFYLSTTLESNDPPEFRSEADEKNWRSVKEIFDQLSEEQVFVLREMYFEFKEVGQRAFETSKTTGMKQKKIFDLMRNVERKVAQQRGLL